MVSLEGKVTTVAGTVYGLITLQAGAAPVVESQPRRHFVVVGDQSGSMRGSKIDQVRAAIGHLAESLTENDTLALVAFNDQASVILPPTAMNAEGQQRVLTLLPVGYAAAGGTDLLAGLEKGLSQLTATSALQCVVLLTDGCDTYGSRGSQRATHLARLAEAYVAAGAGLYVLGLGEDHDAEFLRALSEHTCFPWCYLQTSHDIAPTFARVAAIASSVVARRLRVHLSLAPLLTPPPRFLTPFRCVTRVEDGVTVVDVLIPDLSAGERRDLLLQWDLAAAPATALAEISLEYKSQSGETRVVAPVTLSITTSSEIEAEIETQLARVQVTSVLAEAAAQATRGGPGAARALLETGRAHLLRTAERCRSDRTEETLQQLEEVLAEATQQTTRESSAVDDERYLSCLARGQALQRQVTTTPL